MWVTELGFRTRLTVRYNTCLLSCLCTLLHLMLDTTPPTMLWHNCCYTACDVRGTGHRGNVTEPYNGRSQTHSAIACCLPLAHSSGACLHWCATRYQALVVSASYTM